MRTDVGLASATARTPRDRAADSPGLSFAAVNGWRGPGAIAIAIAHYCVAADLVAYRRLVPISLLVDLFFVLSGLVIAAAYSSKLTNASAFPEYLVRRFGRIWPLQAATLGLLVAYELAKLAMQSWFGGHFESPAFAANGTHLLRAIPTNLLLIQSLGIHDRETWVFPSWSLSVEFATYLSFAAFCLVKPVARRVLAVLTIAASVAVLAFVAPYHMRSTFDYGIFRCLAGFFAGTLCYDVAVRWRHKTWPLPTLVEGTAIVLVIAWMSQSSGNRMAFLAPIVFCVFVLAFTGEGGALSRLLRAKTMQFLAELSFAIYMVHAVVLIFLLAAVHQYQHLVGRALFIHVPNPLAGKPGAPATIEILKTGSVGLDVLLAILYLVGVFGGAYLAYRLVEVPGRSAFGKIAKRVTFRGAAPRIVGSRAPPATGKRTP